MKCVRKSPKNMVFDALETARGQPVVQCPEGALGAVAAALCDGSHEARVLTPEQALNSAPWAVRGRLADLVEDGVQLRTGRADGLAVVGAGVASTASRAGSGPVVWHHSDPQTQIKETFEDAWTAASAVEIDAPHESTVSEAVRSVADDEAVDDLRSLTAPARADPGNPVPTAVWAAAADDPPRSTLLDAVAEAVEVCRRTVERRLSDLQTAGLVATVPDGSDDVGPSECVVTRQATRPLSGAARAALKR